MAAVHSRQSPHGRGCAVLYGQLTEADGYGHFIRWLQTHAVEPPALLEHQFLHLGWPALPPNG